MVDEPDGVGAVRDAMRKDLVAAMKSRSAETVAALRAGLAAIDDAEAVDVTGTPVGGESVIAGASAGLGSAEVPRRVLSVADVRRVLGDVVAEYSAEADRYAGLNRPDAAEQLRRQAAALSRHL
ncbi:hypothetical protein [Mycolicibacterium bacteremicum]|uniref:hypothetical protein n=1 Tax=Mycolicibacterium bacteremicum TaxID=564198 RepID=UPI0026EDA58C|nr:hypothetical protein [Mycolicibacterium bacteremicum]